MDIQEQSNCEPTDIAQRFKHDFIAIQLRFLRYPTMRRFRFSLLTLFVFALTASTLMFLNSRPRVESYIHVRDICVQTSAGTGTAVNGKLEKSVESRIVRMLFAYRFQVEFSGWPYDTFKIGEDFSVEEWETFNRLEDSFGSISADAPAESPVLTEARFLQRWPLAKAKIVNWPEIARMVEREESAISKTLNILIALALIVATTATTEFLTRRSIRVSLAPTSIPVN